MSDLHLERARALQLATVIHLEMLEMAQKNGLQFEDRSSGNSHIYLALAGKNPIWNLNVSIQFDISCPPPVTPQAPDGPDPEAKKPNVVASVGLLYSRKLVCCFQYDGRHNHWSLEAETDDDDAESWDAELPFRKKIKAGESIDLDELQQEWHAIFLSIIHFYQKRSDSIVPQRKRSLPPPPSLPPGAMRLLPLLLRSGFLFFDVYFTHICQNVVH